MDQPIFKSQKEIYNEMLEYFVLKHDLQPNEIPKPFIDWIEYSSMEYSKMYAILEKCYNDKK